MSKMTVIATEMPGIPEYNDQKFKVKIAVLVNLIFFLKSDIQGKTTLEKILVTIFWNTWHL